MKRLSFLLLCMCMWLATSVEAHKPVWAKDIAPILYKHCTSCHNDLGLAPFPLLTYEQAYLNRFSIMSSVKKGHMPPWPPDPSYSRFAGERRLTEDETHLIEEWCSGNASYGDPKDAPKVPIYTNASGLDKPDLVAEMPEYTVPSNKDVYRNFAIKNPLGLNQFITGYDCLPGNPKIVHHILVFADTTGTALRLDANDPQPGYSGFGGVGVSSAEQIGAWVPGMSAIFYPKGMGQLLSKNAAIVLQVHYAPGSQGLKDKSRFIARTGTGQIRRITTIPLLNHYFSLTNGPLVLPANQVKMVKSQFQVPIKGTLIAIAPHMHLLGKSFKVWAVTPTKDTIRLIRINDWDFHWQGTYLYEKAVVFPVGTMLYGETVYDNTVNNPENPNDPPKEVRVGEGTGDEMMLVYFTFAAYQQGDENLLLTPQVPTPNRNLSRPLSLDLKLSPNPTRDELQLQLELPEAERLWIDIFDAQGRTVKSLSAADPAAAGLQQRQFNVSELAPGAYFLRLRTESRYGVASFIVE